MEKFIKENWFRMGILAISAIVGLSAAYYFVSFLPGQKQENLTNVPATSTSGTSTDHPLITPEQKIKAQMSDLTSQAKCAERAAWFFKDGGYDKGTTSDYTSSYTNHWNKSLSECFILITKSGSNPFIKVYTPTREKILSDAFEGRAYGLFNSQGTVGEETIEVCNMNNQMCKSEAEFDNYVRPFMSD